MLSQLKAGLVLGTIFIGAIPPTVILIKGWTAVMPAATDTVVSTAGIFVSAPKLPPRQIVPARANPDTLVNSRIDAGFETVAADPATDMRGSITASPEPAARPDPVAEIIAAADKPAPASAPQPLLPPAPTSETAAGLPPVDVKAPDVKLAAVDPPAADPAPTPAVAAATKPIVPHAAPHTALRALVEKQASADGVPVKMALAVVEIESGFDAGKKGEDGKLGLFQVRLAAVKALGFKGTADDLIDPATNVKWGMKYLAGAYKRADGDTCKTAMKFMAGHYQESYKPIHAAYCKKLEDHMAAIE